MHSVDDAADIGCPLPVAPLPWEVSEDFDNETPRQGQAASHWGNKALRTECISFLERLGRMV